MNGHKRPKYRVLDYKVSGQKYQKWAVFRIQNYFFMNKIPFSDSNLAFYKQYDFFARKLFFLKLNWPEITPEVSKVGGLLNSKLIEFKITSSKIGRPFKRFWPIF